jgi:hypothetical protein
MFSWNSLVRRMATSEDSIVGEKSPFHSLTWIGEHQPNLEHVALSVNCPPILISLAGLELNRFVTDGAGWQRYASDRIGSPPSLEPLLRRSETRKRARHSLLPDFLV